MALARTLILFALLTRCGARASLDEVSVRDAPTDATAPDDAASPSCVEKVLVSSISPTFIALDTDYVYFTSRDKGVGRVTKDGGAPTTYSSFGDSYNLTLDDQYLYWTQGHELARALRVGGGAVEIVATFASDVFGVIVDDTYAYVGDTIKTIWRVPKAGGAPKAIADVMGRPMRMAFDTAYIVSLFGMGFRDSRS